MLLLLKLDKEGEKLSLLDSSCNLSQANATKHTWIKLKNILFYIRQVSPQFQDTTFYYQSPLLFFPVIYKSLLKLSATLTSFSTNGLAFYL